MKYLRKIIALLIGVVFLAALIISLGKIFAIKNINVTLITYDEDSSESYAEAKSALSVYKGESLLFIDGEAIKSTVANSNYSLYSWEKKFPCTVNVTLKERLETFAVAVGGLYSMYDSDGKFLRSSVENININDINNNSANGSPNIELTGIAVENIDKIAKIAATFKENFKSLRSVVKSINVNTNPLVEGYTDRLYFNLRCGLKIQLDDYLIDTEAKIQAAYVKFCTLTDRQKLSGTVRSYRIGGDDGIINADYSAF